MIALSSFHMHAASDAFIFAASIPAFSVPNPSQRPALLHRSRPQLQISLFIYLQMGRSQIFD